MSELHLNTLQNGLPGITEAMGTYFAEAAVVALQKHGHRSGVLFKVSGDMNEEFQITWSPPASKETLANWANDLEATEYGAVAIAILLMLNLTKYRIFEYSKIGSGVDFWLKTDEPLHGFSFFEKEKARLEISGIGTATPANSIEARLRLKNKQIQASGKTNLTAYVIVVEFGGPTAKMIIS